MWRIGVILAGFGAVMLLAAWAWSYYSGDTSVVVVALNGVILTLSFIVAARFLAWLMD